MNRRTLTMNWDGLGEDDDDDRFFEPCERLSSVSAIPTDLASSGSDDDDDKFEDSRRSFASTISSASRKSFRGMETFTHYNMLEDYGMWMAEPGDIKDRRRRLLQGMGLSSNKDLLRLTSAKFVRATSTRTDTGQDVDKKADSCPSEEQKQEPSPLAEIVLVRSRSDGDILSFSSIGNSAVLSSILSDGGIASFFLIKNLDTGKEFIVQEYNEEGAWNKLSDLQTGKQLTMEEFEKSVGYSPVVKELKPTRIPPNGLKLASTGNPGKCWGR